MGKASVGLIVNPERLAMANFSNLYMNMTTAAVVENQRLNKFRIWRAIDEKLIIRLDVVVERRINNINRYLQNTDVVLLETYNCIFYNQPIRG